MTQADSEFQTKAEMLAECERIFGDKLKEMLERTQGRTPIRNQDAEFALSALSNVLITASVERQERMTDQMDKKSDEMTALTKDARRLTKHIKGLTIVLLIVGVVQVLVGGLQAGLIICQL